MVEKPGGGVAALGLAGCIVTRAFAVTGGLDTVVVVGDIAALRSDGGGLVGGVFATTSVTTTVPLEATLFVAGGEPGEFAATSAAADRDRPDPHGLCDVPSATVVLPVVAIGLELGLEAALASDDAPGADVFAVGIDW